MHDFEVLFDHAESGSTFDASRRYGYLAFPPAPADRPWIFSNFVQSLDGIVSLLGLFGSGSHISQSSDDRWLMDLLRTHADAVITGLHTLTYEALYMANPRGPVFKIADPELLELRSKLGKKKLKNIFVTNSANFTLSEYRVFESDLVDSYIVSTNAGASKLRAQKHPNVIILECGAWPRVDLKLMVRNLRQELGIEYLLCEGGPGFYGSMTRADLIDEKFVTIAPVEVGHAAPPDQEMAPFDQTRLRPTTFSGPGFTRDTMTRWKWLSCRKLGDLEFNRYRRADRPVPEKKS